MGPLCTQNQLDLIETQIAKAIDQGGTLICGGKRANRPGFYFEPTIIEVPSQNLDIVDTELFGPVLTVQRFDEEAEVLAKANDSRHGLAAGFLPKTSPAPYVYHKNCRQVLYGSILTGPSAPLRNLGARK